MTFSRVFPFISIAAWTSGSSSETGKCKTSETGNHGGASRQSLGDNGGWLDANLKRDHFKRKGERLPTSYFSRDMLVFGGSMNILVYNTKRLSESWAGWWNNINWVLPKHWFTVSSQWIMKTAFIERNKLFTHCKPTLDKYQWSMHFSHIFLYKMTLPHMFLILPRYQCHSCCGATGFGVKVLLPQIWTGRTVQNHPPGLQRRPVTWGALQQSFLYLCKSHSQCFLGPCN